LREQDEYASGGYPSIARLASDGHFWAVKSIIRRDVVGDGEFGAVWDGKDVFEWCEDYGERHLVKELNYRASVSPQSSA
jgi:hypothetical protein